MSGITTYTGRVVDPFFLSPDEIDIVDIAASLSKLCRFGGHSKVFYSVAQHSVLVSKFCPPEFKLIGLLHDATEAYICDLPSPVKKFLPDYNELEKKVYSAIAARYSLPNELPLTVKGADEMALIVEAREYTKLDLGNIETTFDLTPLAPNEAQAAFLHEYVMLTKEGVIL